MKATIDTKELRNAITKVNMMPRKGHSLPITQHDCQIIFDGEKALLTSTDLEKAIQVKIPAVSDGYTTLVLNRNTVSKFLQGGNGMVTIESDNPQVVKIDRSDLGTITIHTNKPEDYPPTPEDKELLSLELDNQLFIQYLSYVFPACATEDSRPILNGVVFKQGKMASADGFRLVSIVDDTLDFDIGNDFGMVVPLDTLYLFKRLFGKSKSVKLEYNKQRIIFTDGNTRLISQLVQGNFPMYEQLIPKDFVTHITVSTPLLAQRIGMINEKEIASGIIRYHFDTKVNEQVCTLKSGIDDDCITYNLTLPVTISGRANKIAINYKYMLDAIKPFSLAHIELNTPSSPIKLTGDIEGLTIVVMPMFVHWEYM